MIKTLGIGAVVGTATFFALRALHVGEPMPAPVVETARALSESVPDTVLVPTVTEALAAILPVEVAAIIAPVVEEVDLVTPRVPTVEVSTAELAAVGTTVEALRSFRLQVPPLPVVTAPAMPSVDVAAAAGDPSAVIEPVLSQPETKSWRPLRLRSGMKLSYVSGREAAPVDPAARAAVGELLRAADAMDRLSSRLGGGSSRIASRGNG
ncbi:MAG: hypothetical protein O2855_06220 [Planctomycetota bacterium]|nr:hypothetical protein [Planctomycetota bacterium]